MRRDRRGSVAAWRATYAGKLPDDLLAGLSAARRAAMWRQILRSGDANVRVLVAEDESGPVGFGACHRPAPAGAIATDGEVSALYLLRRAQRRGTGRALISALFAFMSTRPMHSAGLWVLRENDAARAFYRRLGASEGIERCENRAGVRPVEFACRWVPIPPALVADGHRQDHLTGAPGGGNK